MADVTRRTFIASLTAAFVAPRLALPIPPAGMVDTVAEDLVVFREYWNDDVIGIRLRVVLIGAAAEYTLKQNPHLWSAVMVKRRLTNGRDN